MTPIATLHGSHCFDAGELRCGWPAEHARSCFTRDCTRTPDPGWAACTSCTQALIDRALGIKAPEPQPELPRWQPAR